MASGDFIRISFLRDRTTLNDAFKRVAHATRFFLGAHAIPTTRRPHNPPAWRG